MLKACAVAVDVQDALFFEVKVNAFLLGPGKQMLARGNGQLGGFDCVFFVVRNGRHELRKP